MRVRDLLRRISWLQIIGLAVGGVGVVRVAGGYLLNGATWLLLGISLLFFKHPVGPDGRVRWGWRSIIGYAAMVAAFILMLAYVILN